jgi:hypothetical protein
MGDGRLALCEPLEVAVRRWVGAFPDIRFRRNPEMCRQRTECLDELVDRLRHLPLLGPQLMKLLAQVPQLNFPTRLVGTHRQLRSPRADEVGSVDTFSRTLSRLTRVDPEPPQCCG